MTIKGFHLLPAFRYHARDPLNIWRVHIINYAVERIALQFLELLKCIQKRSILLLECTVPISTSARGIHIYINVRRFLIA